MENPRVFISYSRKDQPFAQRLAGDLDFHGLDVWWDSWQMRVGDRLDVRIRDAIAECKQFVLILSSNAVQSDWVEKELVYALEREAADENYLILPAFIEDVELPPELSNRVYADFRTSYSKGLEELLKRLKPPIDPVLMRKLLSDKRTHISAAYAAVPEEQREFYINQIARRLDSSASDEEQRNALSCLATLKHPSAAYNLTAKSRTGGLSVRCHAIFLMGESRSKAFVPVLSGLMSDRNASIRAAARTAYTKITGSRL